MIAVPRDAVPRMAFLEFLVSQGFEVTDIEGDIEVSKGTFLRVWHVPEHEHGITILFVEKVANACRLSEDDVANFIASLPDPNLAD